MLTNSLIHNSLTSDVLTKILIIINMIFQPGLKPQPCTPVLNILHYKQICKEKSVPVAALSVYREPVFGV